MTARTLSLFAGPGGFDMGRRILNLPPAHGYDLDADACATAEAAGFTRTPANVATLDPGDFHGARGAIITPPCPSFSAAGLGTGRGDLELLREAMLTIGDNVSDDAHHALCAMATDPRSALVVESLRWALRMPDLQWLVAEQVPAVAPLWEEVASELAAVDYWRYCAVVKVAAEDLGLPSRRTRTFLIAHRTATLDLSGLPVRDLWTCGRTDAPSRYGPQIGDTFPATTMAQALDWPAGERINTRGVRRTSGGNEFSADQASWCLTEKARSWKRVSDGAHLTAAQAGLLTGFPADYPWQGSRSKQFLQSADVVSPPVAAAILGTVLGIDWQPAVRAYLASLYPSTAPAVGYVQPGLFDLIGATA